MIVLAHVGHWSEWLLFAIPLIAVLLAIANNLRRERAARRQRD